MSNWITITVQDLYNSAAAPYIDRADQELLGHGQTKRSDGIIADVTRDIRVKVARASQLDQDATKIPGGFKTLAVDMCIARLKKAIGIEVPEQDLSTIERALNRIADGKERIDLPDNPISTGVTMQGTAPVTSNASRRKASAGKLSGLI